MIQYVGDGKERFVASNVVYSLINYISTSAFFFLPRHEDSLPNLLSVSFFLVFSFFQFRRLTDAKNISRDEYARTLRN